MPSSKSTIGSEPQYAEISEADIAAEMKKSKVKAAKRPRTTGLANLALGLANKNNVSSPPADQMPSLPNPRLKVKRKTSITLVAPDRQTERPLSRTVNVDNVFSGKCYEPRPVRIMEGYTKNTWAPVPINETTIPLCEVADACTINTSHEDLDFYHRELSREEVFHMFQFHGNVAGLCLVRDGTRTPGHYTVTVWDGKSAVNYRVEFAVSCNGQPQYLLSGRTSFKSIAEILLFLYHNPQFFPAAPTMYIPRLPDSVKDLLYSRHFVGI